MSWHSFLFLKTLRDNLELMLKVKWKFVKHTQTCRIELPKLSSPCQMLLVPPTNSILGKSEFWIESCNTECSRIQMYVGISLLFNRWSQKKISSNSRSKSPNSNLRDECNQVLCPGIFLDIIGQNPYVSKSKSLISTSLNVEFSQNPSGLVLN